MHRVHRSPALSVKLTLDVTYRQILDEYKDVESSNYYKEVARDTNNDAQALKKAHAALQHLSRDHARTPMQWDASKNGGFTKDDITPWMRTNTSTKEINVAQQTTSKSSVLAFWRTMCELRRTHSDVLVDAIYETVETTNDRIYALFKRGKRRSAYVVCNFSGVERSMPQVEEAASAKLVACNIDDASSSDTLQPWEGRVYIVG